MVVKFDMSLVRYHAPHQEPGEMVDYPDFLAAKHKRAQRIERNRRDHTRNER
jgi:hypothetical protein